MAAASLVLSLLAVVVSAMTFWWTSLRRGRLCASTPLLYYSMEHGSRGDSTGAQSEAPHLHIRFPTVLFAIGSQPVIVRDLRLELVDGTKMVRLDWAGWTEDGQMPDHLMAKPFVVSESSPVSGELHFIDNQYEAKLEVAGPLQATLLYVGGQGDWRPFHVFPLHIDRETWGSHQYATNKDGFSGSVYG